jgi:hypothetical protein
MTLRQNIRHLGMKKGVNNAFYVCAYIYALPWRPIGII